MSLKNILGTEPQSLSASLVVTLSFGGALWPCLGVFGSLRAPQRPLQGLDS